MIDLDFAKSFVHDLLINVWEQGDTSRFDEFYDKNVTLHYRNEDTKFDGIMERVHYINKICPRRKFYIREICLVGEFIVARIRQTWFDEPTQHINYYNVVVIYRLTEEKKIIEIWMFIDEDVSSYLEIFSTSTDKLPATANSEQEKNKFYEALNVYEYFYNIKKVELTNREKECLYYFLNGYSAKEAARILHISNRTYEAYVATLKQKYHCTTKLELRKKLFPES